METHNPRKLDPALAGNYDVKSSSWISEGFNFLKANMGVLLGFAVIFFLLAMMVQFIPVIGPVAQSIVISPALTLGFFLFAYQYEKQRNPEFSTFFDGFQHLGKLIPIALIQTGIIVALMVPLGVAGFISADMTVSDDISPIFFLIMIPIMAIIFYITVSWMYAYPLAVFFDLKPWDAMETSRKIVSQNFWPLLGFLLLLALVLLGGTLALCVGLLFVYPAVMYAQYASFRDITNLLSDQPTDDILDHLVD